MIFAKFILKGLQTSRVGNECIFLRFGTLVVGAYLTVACGETPTAEQATGSQTTNPESGDTHPNDESTPNKGDDDDNDDNDDNDDAENCASPRIRCGGTCVDTSNNPKHCGKCNLDCAEGAVCQAGACVTIEDCTIEPCTGLSFCDLLTKKCKDGCITDDQCNNSETCDVATHDCVCPQSVVGCGADCKACDSREHATISCNGKTCLYECADEYHPCDESCEADIDPKHCGEACVECPTIEHGQATCTGGECALDCESGFHRCGDACVADDDITQCGEACDKCPTSEHGKASCTNGACELDCNSNFQICDGECVAADTPQHCGPECRQCPVPGGSVAVCNDCKCSFTCKSGTHACSNNCVSDTDPRYCGESCTRCPEPDNGSASCVAGACKLDCDAGFSPCGDKCVRSIGQECMYNEDCCMKNGHHCVAGDDGVSVCQMSNYAPCSLHSECNSTCHDASSDASRFDPAPLAACLCNADVIESGSSYCVSPCMYDSDCEAFAGRDGACRDLGMGYTYCYLPCKSGFPCPTGMECSAFEDVCVYRK